MSYILCVKSNLEYLIYNSTLNRFYALTANLQAKKIIENSFKIVNKYITVINTGQSKVITFN